MAGKKLPKKLTVIRCKEKNTYISCPGKRDVPLKNGVNVIDDPVIIAHLYDETINQGWLSCIEKGVHVVTEEF